MAVHFRREPNTRPGMMLNTDVYEDNGYSWEHEVRPSSKVPRKPLDKHPAQRTQHSRHDFAPPTTTTEKTLQKPPATWDPATKA